MEYTIQVKGELVSLREPQVMGILNCTPDSFFAGSRVQTEESIARRANQISTELKTELSLKLDDFSSPTDTMEETFENREQIEISRFYEKLPKPTLIATEEFIEKSIYWRDPSMPAHSSDEDEL